MLRNLKQIHVGRGDVAAALACSERIALLFPGDPGERAEREHLARRLRAARRWVH